MKIGKYAVPFWLIVTILVSLFGSALGYIVWKTLTIQVEVKEPIEILSYPSQVSLYPGETVNLYISVENHASLNYSIVLNFHLSNTTYQTEYVTFSNGLYTVFPGQENLAALLTVDVGAPAANLTLTIDFIRGNYPSTDGSIGYWNFDEGSGTIVHDSSGNDNNGVLVNGPLWVDGKYGKALSFDGVDDYVLVPDSQSLRVQNFTLEAWVYMTKRPYQHGDVSSAIINKLDYLGGSGTKGYKLVFEGPNQSNDHLVMSVGDGISQRFIIDYNSINDLTLNSWHCIVGTYDGSTAEIFIDGELKATSSASYPVINNNAPLGIGQEVTALPGGNGHFNGLIDGVIVYNRALSAEEARVTFYTNPLL